MISALPPFRLNEHYSDTPTSLYWFRLIDDVTVDFKLPIHGNVSFRDNENSREWALLQDDHLTIRKDYAWDGPTMAPRFDKVMLPSLVHDVLYQFLKTKAMRDRIDRAAADLLFYHAMRVNGFLLRGPYYHAVRKFGHLYLRDDNPVHSVILP